VVGAGRRRRQHGSDCYDHRNSQLDFLLAPAENAPITWMKGKVPTEDQAEGQQSDDDSIC